MEARKAALNLMKNSHFDRTPRLYLDLRRLVELKDTQTFSLSRDHFEKVEKIPPAEESLTQTKGIFS